MKTWLLSLAIWRSAGDRYSFMNVTMEGKTPFAAWRAFIALNEGSDIPSRAEDANCVLVGAVELSAADKAVAEDIGI